MQERNLFTETDVSEKPTVADIYSCITEDGNRMAYLFDGKRWQIGPYSRIVSWLKPTTVNELLESMWVDVDSGIMPEPTESVLVTNGKRIKEAIWIKRTDKDGYHFVFTTMKDITHWMRIKSIPLPKNPVSKPTIHHVE